jgi:hypothetical protein
MRARGFAELAILAVVLPLIVTAPATAAQLIGNGDFSQGLTGWTVTTTSNGVANATPASFDVTGSGTQTAARLNVGVAIFVFDVPPAGGSLVRNFVSAGGQGVFGASIAAQGQQFNNLDGGTFSVWLNGVQKDSFAAGQIGAGEIVRSSLSFTETLLAGNNSLEIRIVRPFSTSANSPFQYVTNVSMLGSVPEPTTWALMILGFGLVGVSMRHRPVSAAH